MTPGSICLTNSPNSCLLRSLAKSDDLHANKLQLAGAARHDLRAGWQWGKHVRVNSFGLVRIVLVAAHWPLALLLQSSLALLGRTSRNGPLLSFSHPFSFVVVFFIFFSNTFIAIFFPRLLRFLFRCRHHRLRRRHALSGR